MIYDPRKMPRTCTVCLMDEGSPELHEDCKHRFIRHRIWAAIVVTDMWASVRSEKKALRLFGELCFDRSCYELGRAITDDEADLLIRGKLKLTMHLEPAEPESRKAGAA